MEYCQVVKASVFDTDIQRFESFYSKKMIHLELLIIVISENSQKLPTNISIQWNLIAFFYNVFFGFLFQFMFSMYAYSRIMNVTTMEDYLKNHIESHGISHYLIQWGNFFWLFALKIFIFYQQGKNEIFDLWVNFIVNWFLLTPFLLPILIFVFLKMLVKFIL